MTDKRKATDLKHFITEKMRMSHIYQPVMIKTLLQSGGEATTEEIATSLYSPLLNARLHSGRKG